MSVGKAIASATRGQEHIQATKLAAEKAHELLLPDMDGAAILDLINQALGRLTTIHNSDSGGTIAQVIAQSNQAGNESASAINDYNNALDRISNEKGSEMRALAALAESDNYLLILDLSKMQVEAATAIEGLVLAQKAMANYNAGFRTAVAAAENVSSGASASADSAQEYIDQISR